MAGSGPSRYALSSWGTEGSSRHSSSSRGGSTADDPNWVPPLILDQLRFFTPGKNPYFSHSTAQLFMAFRGDEPVGRISAHENNQHIRVHQDGAGFFGFFECIDDQAVADALLDAASTWLPERGLETPEGARQLLRESRSRIAPRCLRRAAPHPDDLQSPVLCRPDRRIRLAEDPGPVRVRHVRERGDSGAVARPSPIVFSRTPSSSSGRWMSAISRTRWTRIKKIYAEAWSENWGAVPLTEEEFDRIVGELQIDLRPGHVLHRRVRRRAGRHVAGASRYEPGPEEGRRPAVPLGFAEDALAPAEDRRLAHAHPGGPARTPPARHRGRLLLSHVRRRQDEAGTTGRASCPGSSRAIPPPMPC